MFLLLFTKIVLFSEILHILHAEHKINRSSVWIFVPGTSICAVWHLPPLGSLSLDGQTSSVCLNRGTAVRVLFLVLHQASGHTLGLPPSHRRWQETASLEIDMNYTPNKTLCGWITYCCAVGVVYCSESNPTSNIYSQKTSKMHVTA